MPSRKGPEDPSAKPAVNLAEQTWLKDPDYLDELRLVARLDLQGNSGPQIAQKIGRTLDYVRACMKHIQQIRVATVDTSELFEMRQRSIEQFRLVQEEAWARLQKVPASSRSSSDLLNQVASAEREIVRLQGTLTVLRDDDQYDRSIHVQIINDITERVSRVPRPGGVGKLSELPEPGGGPGGQVLLGTVGETDAATATGPVADVVDARWSWVGQDAGPGHEDTHTDWLDDNGVDPAA